MYEKEMLDIPVGHGGYPVSSIYPLLDKTYTEDTVFVLFKESTRTIEDHLLYGYYNGIYPVKVLNDFDKYWDVNFRSGVVQRLDEKVEKYYSRVEDYFGNRSNFLVADLSSFGGSWNNWITSDSFTRFIGKLPHSNPMLIANVPGIQARVAKKKTFPYFDYLTPGPYYGVPEGLALGTFFGSFPMPMANDHNEAGHVDHLIKTLTAL
jgi:hypothetical protein